MRINSFLKCKTLKRFARSRQCAEYHWEGIPGYDNASMIVQSNPSNEVRLIVSYSDIKDLLQQGKIRQDSSVYQRGLMMDLDLRLSCERFPSIKMGDASPVELYTDVTHEQDGQVDLLVSESRNRYLPSNLGNTWQLLGSSQSYIGTSASRDFEVTDQILPAAEDVKASRDVPTEDVIHRTLTTVPFVSCLDTTLKGLPGITNKKFCCLDECGFHTVRKLLHHFPRSFANMHNVEETIYDGQYIMFVGTILSSRAHKASPSLSFLEVVVCCTMENRDSGNSGRNIYLHLKKFFRGIRFTYQPFLRSVMSKYEEADCVYVCGKIKKLHRENHYEVREYSIDVLKDKEEHDACVDLSRPYPIYPSKGTLKAKDLKDIISRTLKIVATDIDPLPNDILGEFKLLNLHDAYMGIHCPKSLDEADFARRRFIFDEFFYLQLARLFQMLGALGTQIEKENLIDKYKSHGFNTVCAEKWTTLTRKFLQSLPYSLTPSQMNAVCEIIWDLKRPVPMNRLLQGDVGCGKTVVAFLTCMEVIGSGFQAAFMVPTELLAHQHYEHLLSLLENIEDPRKPYVALLTGSTSSKESRAILEGLRSGEISLVIGTHSLITDKIEFLALRIAVVDEQHRFGVIQRGRFNSKLYSVTKGLRLNERGIKESGGDKDYMAPHILSISATPIPRTLAWVIYGDMPITQITDARPGRVPVQTIVLQGNEAGLDNTFQMMEDELTKGGKIYIVYPLIEESEQLPQLRSVTTDFILVSKKLSGYQCGMLHGRMRSEEKDEALRKFKSGETRVLLATQVIEIGVDVPDATMMAVMNAERFGISQLHQLRGRVGRGTRKSRCIFLSSTSGALGRLRVLENSSDGFYVSNADLLIRGPGDLLGKKQSGHVPEFPIARLEVDGDILKEAYHAAVNIIGKSSNLEIYPKLKAELSMRQPLCILGD